MCDHGSPAALGLNFPEREMKGLDWLISMGSSNSDGSEFFISFHIKLPVPASRPLGGIEIGQWDSYEVFD